MTYVRVKRAHDTIVYMHDLLNRINEHHSNSGVHEVRVQGLLDTIGAIKAKIGKAGDESMPDPSAGLFEFTVAYARASEHLIKYGSSRR